MSVGELASGPKRLQEYSFRKNRFLEKTFPKGYEEAAQGEGWTLKKENKNSNRFVKLKPVDEQHENELWCLLYNLGYPFLNVGRNFQIEITKDQKDHVSKQIDVFAYDDETIIIAECKTQEKKKPKSLQKDLTEFDGLKKYIVRSLEKHFGEKKIKRKLLWLFCTNNIEWTKPDIARAKEFNIRVITEKDMIYYKEIAKQIGHAARYQFHAEFFAQSKIGALENSTVCAIRTKLGTFNTYTFFAPARKILPVTFVNHRDLRDPTAAPSYQRLIQRSRLKEIGGFLKTGGFFPNSIILNFKSKVRFEQMKAEDDDGITPGVLYLPSAYKSAWIIDGQHRLYGYTEVEPDEKVDHLPFLAFERISAKDETELFATINSKQKNVSRKLLDEIAGEIKFDSPSKREQIKAIASRAFDMMREDDSGPLGGKISHTEIKRDESSILTIPYLTTGVLQSGLLGRVLKKDGVDSFIQGQLYWETPKDALECLVILLSRYFDLFRDANPERWDSGRESRFCANPGTSALIRFLSDVIDYMAKSEHEDPRTLDAAIIVERIEAYLAPVLLYFKEAPDNEFQERFKVPFGSGGLPMFQHRLRELLHSKYSNFKPEGFDSDLRRYSKERAEAADKMVKAIQENVHRFVVDKLKAHYGGGSDFLEKAVDNPQIVLNATEARLKTDEKDRKPVETYLNFLDLRKIVEHSRNWGIFSSTLSIQLPDEQKGKSKYVKWFDTVNELRKHSAHPYNRSSYSDEEYKNAEYIFNTLIDRGVIEELDA